MSSRPAQENFQPNTLRFQLTHHSILSPVATHSSTSHTPGFHLLLALVSVLIYLGLFLQSLDPHFPGLFSLETPNYHLREHLAKGPSALGCRNPGRTMDPQTPIPTTCLRAGARALLAPKPTTPDHSLPSGLFPFCLTHLLRHSISTSPSMHIPLIWHYFLTQQH